MLLRLTLPISTTRSVCVNSHCPTRLTTFIQEVVHFSTSSSTSSTGQSCCILQKFAQAYQMSVRLFQTSGDTESSHLLLHHESSSRNNYANELPPYRADILTSTERRKRERILHHWKVTAIVIRLLVGTAISIILWYLVFTNLDIRHIGHRHQWLCDRRLTTDECRAYLDEKHKEMEREDVKRREREQEERRKEQERKRQQEKERYRRSGMYWGDVMAGSRCIAFETRMFFLNLKTRK